LPVDRHVELAVQCLVVVEFLVALPELAFEEVGHGDELDGSVRARQRVGSRSRTTPPAADQSHLDQIGSRRVDRGYGYAGKGGCSRQAAGVLQQFTARGNWAVRVPHGWAPGSERLSGTHAQRMSGTHPGLEDGRSGQERQVAVTPPFGSSWSSSTP